MQSQFSKHEKNNKQDQVVQLCVDWMSNKHYNVEPQQQQIHDSIFL